MRECVSYALLFSSLLSVSLNPFSLAFFSGEKEEEEAQEEEEEENDRQGKLE